MTLTNIVENFFGIALASRTDGICNEHFAITLRTFALQKTLGLVHGLLYGLIQKKEGIIVI